VLRLRITFSKWALKNGLLLDRLSVTTDEFQWFQEGKIPNAITAKGCEET